MILMVSSVEGYKGGRSLREILSQDAARTLSPWDCACASPKRPTRLATKALNELKT